MRGVYGNTVRLIALAMILLGVVIVARTLSLGAGPFSFGFIVGLILIGIGSARLWLAIKMARPSDSDEEAEL